MFGLPRDIPIQGPRVSIFIFHYLRHVILHYGAGNTHNPARYQCRSKKVSGWGGLLALSSLGAREEGEGNGNV